MKRLIAIALSGALGLTGLIVTNSKHSNVPVLKVANWAEYIDDGTDSGIHMVERFEAWYEEKNAEDIPADVKAVAEERWAARQNRDWAKSDELRAKLADMGYAVKDSKTGYELTKM